MLHAAVGPRCLSHSDEPDYNQLARWVLDHPQGMATAWQKKSVHALSVGIVKHSLLGQVTSFHEGLMDIFHGVQLMATHNVRKEVGVVNGATGALLFHFDNSALHPVWSISESENDEFRSGLPIRHAFHDQSVSVTGYVAMTRVRRLRNLFWVRGRSFTMGASSVRSFAMALGRIQKHVTRTRSAPHTTPTRDVPQCTDTSHSSLIFRGKFSGSALCISVSSSAARCGRSPH